MDLFLKAVFSTRTDRHLNKISSASFPKDLQRMCIEAEKLLEHNMDAKTFCIVTAGLFCCLPWVLASVRGDTELKSPLS